MKLRFRRDYKKSLFGDSEVFVAAGEKAIYRVEESAFGGWGLVVIPVDEAYKMLPETSYIPCESKGECMDIADKMEE